MRTVAERYQTLGENTEIRTALERTLEAGDDRPAGEPEDALVRADRAEALAQRLEQEDIDEAVDLSASLADAGVTLEELDTLLEGLSTAARPAAAAWLAWTRTSTGLAAEVVEATGRLSALIAAMRNYNRLDEAPEQDVDLRRGLEDTLAILSPRLADGVTVRREYDEALPTVPGWPGELNQVWTNLIENAADAMGGSGVLHVATARRDDRALVTVTDSGPGVPPEIAERIFDPFFTTKPVGQGVGLGLDTARRIVQGRHRGEIRLRSRPGATRFEVLLPLRGLELGD